MKKILTILMILTFAIFIVSCDTTGQIKPVKLATPVVTLNDNIASWNKISNASKYQICINNELSYISSDQTSITLENNQTLNVKAIGNNTLYTNSDWSNQVTYVASTTNPEKLTTPVVSLSDNIASWNKISNASQYLISINNVLSYVSSDQTSITLESNQTLKVKAIGDNILYTDSDWSNQVTYVDNKTPTLTDEILKEYNDLKNGLTSNHTTWSFSGTVVALNNTLNNDQTYNIELILDVEGIKIGIINALQDNKIPTSILGLEKGKVVNVEGLIDENEELILEQIHASVVFNESNISWEHETVTVSDVNFLMINDTHGALIDSSAGYSIGRVDTIKNQIASNSDCILIHNGDALQGSFISGELYGLPLIEAMNEMDFDCFVLGNHEFDWGLDKIEKYADGNLDNGEAEFPFLGANIYYKGTNTRPDWINPYTIVEYGGLKVGIIGAIGKSQESSILTSNVEDYEFVDPTNLIKNYAKTLRTTKDCDIVVVAIHDYDSYLNSTIAKFSGDYAIDAIFCGHTHQLINEEITRSDSKEILVVQNYHKNVTATNVTIHLDDNLEYASSTTKIYYPKNYAISSSVQNIINNYQDLINSSNESLGVVSYEISKNTLGSYAVDAMLECSYSEYEFGEIDVAVINTGGVRATVDSGSITRADIFEVFPFNNKIVIVNLSGALIKSLYNENRNYLYIDVVDSLESYAYLDDNTIYQLAVIDYVFEGTYYYQFDGLLESDYIETEIILRNEMISYIDSIY